MAYIKNTVEMFQEKLKTGGYPSLAGARRAVGRMTEWAEEDREKGQKLINKHFTAEPGKAPKPKAVTGKKRGRPAKVVAAPVAEPKRRGRPPKNPLAVKPVKPVKEVKAAAPASPPKKRGRPRKNPVVEAAPKLVKQPRQIRTPKATKSGVSLMDGANIASKQVDVIKSAVTVIGQCKDLGVPQADITSGARKAAEALSVIIDDLYKMGRTQSLPSDAEARGAKLFEQAVEAAKKGNQVPMSATGIPEFPTP